jgi:cephalosporin hydroxylase
MNGVSLRAPGIDADKVIDQFHRLYYEPVHEHTRYMGVPLWKSPNDLWLYQDVICRVQPKLILEMGTAFGGSALYFAHLMDNAGIDGEVVTVDIEPGESYHGFPLPRHPRITYLREMSSVAPEGMAFVREHHLGAEPVMVILDSDHHKEHVLEELGVWAQMCSPSSYLVVEDVNINGHPVFPEYGTGPYEALEAWLPEHPEFQRDEELSDRYLFSMHAWLRRKAA